jgi:hypothetical protein
MGRMTNEDVGRLLHELSERNAADALPTPGFTGRVLERLEAGHRYRGSWSSLGLAIAAVLVATVVAIAIRGGKGTERGERSRTAARVRQLRDEYRDLQSELEKLRALTEEVRPVLELGSTDRVDFVLDLTELPREERAMPRPDAKPVSQTSSGDER